MFCENCGHKVEEGEQFCPNCGQRVEIEEATEKTTEKVIEKAIEKAPAVKRKGKGKIIAVWTALICIILILAAAATIFFVKKSEGEKQAELKKQEEQKETSKRRKDTKRAENNKKEEDIQKKEEQEEQNNQSESEKTQEKELPEAEPAGTPTGLTHAGSEIYMVDFTVSASSVLEETGYNYETQNLTDVDWATCWADGAAGNGVNESILFTSAQEQTVRGLAFLPGIYTSEELYWKNGAPEALHIEYGDEAMDYSYTDKGSAFITGNAFDGMIYIDFGKEVKISECKVTITGVRDGNKYDDCCITEMFLYR